MDSGERNYPLALFKQPVPADSLILIDSAIGTVYGTGSVIQMTDKGEYFAVMAPSCGLGERTHRKRLSRTSEGEPLVSLAAPVGGLVVEFSKEQVDSMLAGFAEYLMDALHAYHAENFVTARVTDGDGESFSITLQRESGKTAQDLRAEAEARVVELEAELNSLRKAVSVDE
jgi:hypothetical protein